ncbi:MAG: methionyl-tRNA formyltransferase [Flavobacteriales bacterium]|nr:MAG: methionyl-tRNA formyltransferase [Flavobacteriales bacterium]
MSKKLRIVFMGTPGFAVTILNRIVHSSHDVVAVVTAPDRPSGRGQKIRKSEVKIYAEDEGLTIFQPLNLKADEFINEMKKVNADVFVVVAFRMLPAVIWKIPPLGTINLHASLLPDYRGAAPINWTIINGEKRTGVTTFFINEVIDTGDIIKKRAVDINDEMSAGELHDKLMHVGADLMNDTLTDLSNGKLESKNQNEDEGLALNAAPKIFKEDCQIQWANTLKTNYNKIRGLSPYPGAWSVLKSKSKNKNISFKFFDCRKTNMPVPTEAVGQLLEVNNGILFPCSDFYILVVELQMEGKRRMNYKDFLAGNSIEDFEIIKEP